ncbi:DUF294 nucleotidyltransferase-like domain-containing protein [Saliterribacillus persicus]|uniref:CBS domain-containing protein n=1 Tax=Saliterribacillus persicus TaxID=930114 RepID=A0A368Y1I2_9BACI|nr:DUF294 nucleotidyltransferase-like domain-containing protein [Saliterribacillus persicus]RCW73158.1 CBS domain-containing protein [Saliterribacillus persicus]
MATLYHKKEMTSGLRSYQAIKVKREKTIKEAENHYSLNKIHDEVMKDTVELAIKNIESEQGKIPAPFAFFLMGSAGRSEQSVWSDQDHGILFDGKDDLQPYFLKLGTEIMRGLEEVGYEKCDGKVMSSESRWCQSITSFEEQIIGWLDEATWQSLRHFGTFFDSRVLIGEETYLEELKQSAFSFIEENPHIYKRLVDNVDFVRKGIGIFGQLLPEQSGSHSGEIALKTTTFFPYVNALRLLSLLEHETVPQTIERFKVLEAKYSYLKEYQVDFEELLAFRFEYRKDAKTYDEVHYLPLSQLNKEDKQLLKYFMKKGYALFYDTKSYVEEACVKW